MIDLTNVSKIMIYPGYVDFRKSINGLCYIIKEDYGDNPFDNSLYMFCSKDRTRVKIIHYEKNGFWLYMKRLEEDKFRWPKKGEKFVISAKQLEYLFDGLDINPKGKFTEKLYEFY